MEYEHLKLIADESLKRLHADLPKADPSAAEIRKNCDFGQDTSAVVGFLEAVRLYNEEAYRPCGNCLMEGGEVSNWKERAEQAEQRNNDLERRAETSDKLAGDWKTKADDFYRQLCELRERAGLEKAP